MTQCRWARLSWNSSEFVLKKNVLCRRHIFTIFYTLGREAESTHSEHKQHMEIVHILAEGSESRDWGTGAAGIIGPANM